MAGMKPQVVYFSDEQEMVDLVKLTLSANFDVTPVIGQPSLEETLETLRVLKPNFVIIDPNLPGLDHQQLTNVCRQTLISRTSRSLLSAMMPNLRP